MEVNQRTVFGVLLVNRVSISIDAGLMRSFASTHQGFIDWQEEITSLADTNLVNKL